ncbi:hypothetical protein [Alkalihalobacillus sp. LMS39]|uniref:hypothetical protein n=1 Tax=Alkalihalobacillus sp. LMS39 TaxID=2924032 RepID=UPI001FB280E8|nr:hypothetical protein [Alkalihalobacillus sp. LMS39]UOE93836.1 hypothetical protein MM271_22110 [Alkalihalobacillus sp. LMS39]
MRQNTFPVKGLAILIGGISLILLVMFLIPSDSQQAKKTIQQFYKHEQQWDFISAWNLFHPKMQDRFSKPSYLQNRSHIFMDHFGVDSFSFSLDNPKKVTDWTMTTDGEVFEVVYKVTVTKEYKGTYGNFSIIQDVYATKEENNWVVLWDYND